MTRPGTEGGKGEKGEDEAEGEKTGKGEERKGESEKQQEALCVDFPSESRVELKSLLCIRKDV